MLKFTFALIALFATSARADITENTRNMMMDIEIEIAVGQEEVPFLTPPKNKVGLTETQCLAVAIYHEARGEELLGQIAVASVILQRSTVPGRWGDNACDVVTAIQFSFMTSDVNFPEITEMGPWFQSLVIARYMMARGPIAELPYADHYHASYVSPSWRKKMPKVTQIGKHIFYADPISKRRLKASL